MSYKKIISVILSLLILFHPFVLYADDLATSSARIRKHKVNTSPKEEVTNTPAQIESPQEASDEATLSETNTATESASMTQNDNNLSENASASAAIEEQSNNTNTADININIEAESSTGDNHTENNIISEINTGDAEVTADSITLANNNIEGQDIQQEVVNVSEDHVGDINLANTESCQDMSEAAQNDFTGSDVNSADNSKNNSEYKKKLYERIYNENKAKIINNITLIAKTGDNTSKDIINTIETGDADVTLHVFNMVNTNLIGNCGYFGVINIYGDQTGDIVLPYELGYLNADSLAENKSQEGSSDLQNGASIKNNIETEANTGENSATGYSQIQSGASVSNIRLADTANTNIIGDRWALVLVTYYGDWDGGIENWDGNIESKPHSVLMWVRLPSANPAERISGNENQNTGDSLSQENMTETASDTEVQNKNDASVENNIRLAADTGNNSADGRVSTIKTGNASVTLNEATVANTNIIGNNWFFAIINIFGNFVGNIVFPRPDISVTKTADKSDASEGEDIVYTIAFTNKGKYKAENVYLTDILPSNAEAKSYSSGGSFANNTITWKIGTLEPGQSGNVSVILHTVKTSSDVVNTASISTTTNEPIKTNNNSSAVTHIHEKEVAQTVLANTTINQPRYYSNSPVTASEINSLFVNKYRFGQPSDVHILSLPEYAQRSPGNNFCKINVAVCSGGGISISALIYWYIKKRVSF